MGKKERKKHTPQRMGLDFLHTIRIPQLTDILNSQRPSRIFTTYDTQSLYYMLYGMYYIRHAMVCNTYDMHYLYYILWYVLHTTCSIFTTYYGMDYIRGLLGTSARSQLELH